MGGGHGHTLANGMSRTPGKAYGRKRQNLPGNSEILLWRGGVNRVRAGGRLAGMKKVCHDSTKMKK